jgi:hypothetical protein
VADEPVTPGVCRTAPHDSSRQVHPDQHVPGDADPADQLALAVLDLGDLLHRDLDLEDVAPPCSELEIRFLEVGPSPGVSYAGVRKWTTA